MVVSPETSPAIDDKKTVTDITGHLKMKLGLREGCRLIA
jgi:hypothetical protein